MRVLIWLLLAYLVYRMVRRKKEAVPEKKGAPAAETFRDPFCGVYVAQDDAVVGVLEGKRLYFCSRGCLEQFQQQLHEPATPKESGGNG